MSTPNQTGTLPAVEPTEITHASIDPPDQIVDRMIELATGFPVSSGPGLSEARGEQRRRMRAAIAALRADQADRRPTHTSIFEVLRRARDAIQQTITAWGCGSTQSVDANRQLLAQIDQLIDGFTQPNPDANGFFWWLFAIGVDGELVAEQVVLDAQKLHRAVSSYWLYANIAQFKIKLIGGPDQAAINKVQS